MIHTFKLRHDAFIEANIIKNTYDGITYITVYMCHENNKVFADERHTFIEVGATATDIDINDRQAVLQVVKQVFMNTIDSMQ